MKCLVHILNCTVGEDLALDQLARRVEAEFRCIASIDAGALDFSGAFDESRGQHQSTIFLAQLMERHISTHEKIIAIVNVDLYIPVLTFVFGEAQFNGSVAVASTHRLAEQRYGLPANDALMRQRLHKEVVHELGHTFGLYHCRQFECVMRSSTSVEEIDGKAVHLCGHCINNIQEQSKTVTEVLSKGNNL